jgi:UDP-N-acetylglucosamine 2-epimerase (non-hydrolysing)
MKKLKVMTVVGTRPEIIRLSRVLARLDETCDHILVHTGQNYDYELSQVFFDDLEIRKPDFFLDAAGASTSAVNTIGNIISAMDPLLAEVNPDAMLILGDTNSCLSVISAKRRKIPVFHMEAGNRCFDQRVPEEINRRIVDHTADVNLTYSSIAREYLLREGLPPDLVIKTGSPMAEVLNYYKDRILASSILSKMQLSKGKYFLVSAHREENIDAPQSFSKLVRVLNALAEDYQLPVIVSCHPRTKKKIDTNEVVFHSNVKIMKPLGFHDYVKLQMDAKTVLSDSGTITEESSILGFPSLNLRESHERPEGMEEAAVMMVGLDLDRVRQGLALLDSTPRGMQTTKQVADYDVLNVSEKIVRLIHSYTDYVNRVVWKKY